MNAIPEQSNGDPLREAPETKPRAFVLLAIAVISLIGFFSVPLGILAAMVGFLISLKWRRAERVIYALLLPMASSLVAVVWMFTGRIQLTGGFWWELLIFSLVGALFVACLVAIIHVLRGGS